MHVHCFEDFEVDMLYEHELRRTITEGDNVLLSCLTLNLQPLHIDANFAAASMWGRVLVDSMVTMGVLMGIHETELTRGTSQGSLRIAEVSFPKPVFHGDTLRARTRILGKRDSGDQPGHGVIDFRLQGFNQRDELIMDCRLSRLIRRRA